MSGLGSYLITECYGGVLCVVILLCFLIFSRKYDRTVKHYFYILSILALIDIIGGKTESFLGRQPTFYYIRLVLSWINYIVSPGLLLICCELLLRNKNKKIRWLIAIPEIINAAVVSTAFFAPWCFYINPNNNIWGPGPIAWVTRYMPAVYLLILLISAFSNIRQSKWECRIIIMASFLLGGVIAAESVSLTPVSIREITIGLTLLSYFMYFASINHMDEIKELNVTHQDEITELNVTHRDEITELNVTHQDEITELNVIHQDEIKELNVTHQDETNKNNQNMIDQCIETLAYTIDAKDKYTRGHSTRVAKYSKMLASLAFKQEEECRQIYLAGLLHDIGKISINDAIINKNGKLTEDEYREIKNHPSNGALILEKMKSIPFLQNGAKYHHERWDGKGYPTGIAGEEIPEYARIIAVADAYDAMTSNRSYRAVMDQAVVKQEIWKGSGTQFDPYYAKLMISLIDADVDYSMREKEDEQDEIIIDKEQKEIVWPSAMPLKITAENTQMQETDFAFLAAFVCAEEHWSNPSRGFLVTGDSVKVSFRGVTRQDAKYVWNAPVILVYSSEDGQVTGPNYEELAVIMCAGYSWRSGAALSENISFVKEEAFQSWDNWVAQNKAGLNYRVLAIRGEDHIQLTITNNLLTVKEYIDMPADYPKDIYISLCGERNDIYDINVG